MEATNDGGVVLALFFMVATIAIAIFSAVGYYESSTRTANDADARLLRLISGWANIGNCIVHIFLHVGRPRVEEGIWSWSCPFDQAQDGGKPHEGHLWQFLEVSRAP